MHFFVLYGKDIDRINFNLHNIWIYLIASSAINSFPCKTASRSHRSWTVATGTDLLAKCDVKKIQSSCLRAGTVRLLTLARFTWTWLGLGGCWVRSMSLFMCTPVKGLCVLWLQSLTNPQCQCGHLFWSTLLL